MSKQHRKKQQDAYDGTQNRHPPQWNTSGDKVKK
jgi:hypothetical protein